MVKVLESDFEFTHEQIVKAATTWANFNGFSGEVCHQCKKTANVLAGGHGWFCVCGAYNAQNFHDYWIPRENPDLGPTEAVIQAAYAEAPVSGCGP